MWIPLDPQRVSSSVSNHISLHIIFLLWTFLVLQVCWQLIVSAFICLYFVLVFERYFCYQVYNSKLTYFFQYQDVIPLFSHLCCFWWVIVSHACFFSPLYVIFSLATFMMFSFSPFMNTLILSCLGAVFLIFLVLGIHWTS